MKEPRLTMAKFRKFSDLEKKVLAEPGAAEEVERYRMEAAAEQFRYALTCALKPAEDGGYVATCPELGVVSQGDTVVEATVNLREAVELFFEFADPAEIEDRYRQYRETGKG